MRSMLALRWVIVGLATILGIALIARGTWIVGALVLALACTRVAMLVTVHRRRAAILQRRRRWNR